MRTLILALALMGAFGCAADTYDPDWNANDVIANGKADGLLDELPELEIGGESISGEIGGPRAELYVLSLRRTESVEITMTVDSGDLNPHLSLFRGTSTYVASDDWSRSGDTLKKTYTVEEEGRYLVAARAYRGEGFGDYTLSVTCEGGPCAGDFPAPGTEMYRGDVEECLSMARQCAFDDLPRWEGRVGAVRAQSIFTRCLETVALDDGTSCVNACNWQAESAGSSFDHPYDHAQAHCDTVVAALPFYADQSAACIGTFESCYSDCEDVGGWQTNSDDSFGETVEATCFSSGLNSDCDVYSRLTEACGGGLIPDGAQECYERCLGTSGAFVDDTSDICDSGGEDCGQYCDVEMEAWADDCGGGIDRDNFECFRDKVDSGDIWICEDWVEEAIDNL